MAFRIATLAVGFALSLVLVNAAIAADRIAVIDLTDDGTRIWSADSADAILEGLSRACDDADMEQFREYLRAVRARHTDRWISTEGDTLYAFALYSGSEPNFEFDERARRTRLEEEIDTLVDAIGLTTAGVATADVRVTRCLTETYVLRHERAFLEMTVDGNSRRKVVVVTGPREHWFPTGNVMLGSVDARAANGGNGNRSVFATVGLDFSVGDLHTPRGIGRLVVKGLVGGVSDQAQLSFGFGVGCHCLPANLLPFVGFMWTREQETERPSIHIGVSYNFIKAFKSVLGQR